MIGSPVKIELDWRAYFKEFCAAHGEPVEWRGRLLFADGWGYSRTDYAGPEYPPPVGPALLKARLAYWVIRRRMVEAQLKAVKADAVYYERLQACRALPLFQRLEYYGEDADGAKRARRESVPLDLGLLKDRLRWLIEEDVKCKEEIVRLKKEYSGGADAQATGAAVRV